MNADIYRTLAVVFLALAAILAVVAVVLFRKFNIPAVRDALTGKRAEREIAELRGVRAGSWANAENLGEGSRRKRKKVPFPIPPPVRMTPATSNSAR